MRKLRGVLAYTIADCVHPALAMPGGRKYRISRTDLSRITGVPMGEIKAMSEAGAIPCEAHGSDPENLRYSYDLSAISAICPKYLDGSSLVIARYLDGSSPVSYRRPRKIPQAKIPNLYNRKVVRVKYIRDAKAALAIGAGMEFREKAALSVLIDLMALHENQGIPAQPPSYIAGMLGVGQRTWTEGIMPKLLAAKKIRHTRRDGIEVFMWGDQEVAGRVSFLIEHDPSVTGIAPVDLGPLVRADRRSSAGGVTISIRGEPSSGPPAEMFAMGYAPQAPKPLQTEDGTPVLAGQIPTDREIEAEITEDAAIVAAADLKPEVLSPREAAAERIERMADPRTTMGVDPDEPQGEFWRVDRSGADLKPEVEPVPAVSALEVLRQAGLPVYDHPRGEFFWARTEHTEVLNRWLQTVPLSEVVARIARAWRDGEISPHPNGMAAFEGVVIE